MTTIFTCEILDTPHRSFWDGITHTSSIVWHRSVEFLVSSDMEYSEFQSCLMALLWGFWLSLYPFSSTFDSLHFVGIYPSFGKYLGSQEILRTLMPSWMWSFWFTALGVGQLISLAKRVWTARRLFAFVATCSWLFVSAYLALTDYRLVTVPTTFFFAVGSAWSYWRLRSYMHHFGQ